MPFRLEPARDRKLYRLVKRAEAVEVPKGGPIYRPGEAATHVYVVREGVVALTLPPMEDGKDPRTVGVAVPWEMFGDEGFGAGHRRYAAVAATRCVVHPLETGAVLQGLKTARSSLAAYLGGTERELHRLRHAQGGSRGPSAPQRVAEVLLDLAERCGERDGRRLVFGVRITHKLLADLAGAHRATVTTLLNDWLYEGILATDDDRALILARPTDLWVLAGYHGSGVSSGLAGRGKGGGGAEP